MSRRMRFSDVVKPTTKREALENYTVNNQSPDFIRPEGGDLGKVAEKKMVEGIDVKDLMLQELDTWVPVFRKLSKERDPDMIMREASPLAALTQVALLLGGSERAKVDVSKQILDRVMGKPVDRSVNLSADIMKLRDVEIDHELRRLIHKLPVDELRSLARGPGQNRETQPSSSPPLEGSATRGEETLGLQAQQDAGEVPDEQEENKGTPGS